MNELIFKHSKSEPLQSKSTALSLKDFEIKLQLAKGRHGKVYLAQHKVLKSLHAIKMIKKTSLISTDTVDKIKLEKEILLDTEHPFVIKMEYMFQTKTMLYFVMPFIRSELFMIFIKQKRFSEKVVKFYASQVVSAVGYLHSKGIIHRDLKIENILIDQLGYIKIIDFGIAKLVGQEKPKVRYSLFSIQNTDVIEYLAPEMLKKTQSSIGDYSFSVDWWAVGILMYELYFGVTPFFDEDQDLIQENIENNTLVFPDREKWDFSNEFEDIIMRLLDKDVEKRLGSTNDFTEILNHPFFKEINMRELELYEIEPPFMP